MLQFLRKGLISPSPACFRRAPNVYKYGVSTSNYSTDDGLAYLNSGELVFEHEQVPVDKSPKQQDEPGRKKRILSGVQPTGKPTLGNYLGALKNWVELQDSYENFFCVMDLHAVTASYDPKELRQSTRDMAALYLASGIDPAKSTVFVQSHVAAHTGLCWLLACHTPVNWLARQAQFAEKSSRITASGGGEARTGLLTYPVLMAADILLYQTDLVPVGDDQRQHLQVAKELAFRFNRDFALRMKEREKEERARFKEAKRKQAALEKEKGKERDREGEAQARAAGQYGEASSSSAPSSSSLAASEQAAPSGRTTATGASSSSTDASSSSAAATTKRERPQQIEPLFRMPEIFTPPAGARIMSLQDGRSKMSKSHPNDGSRINLTDTADQIRQKIKRCKTDSIRGLSWDDPERPECANLMTIYQICAGKTREEVTAECTDLSWGPFKDRLAEAVVEHLRPIQGRYAELQTDPAYLDALLASGAETAAAVADRTLERVRDAMGFLPAARR